MNKSNNLLYLALLAVSLMAFGFSFCFSSANREFTLLASIGCSGIVSVLVTWLIERANERIQKTHDREIVELLLDGFDIRITAEMQRALARCARENNVDMDKSYSVMEIRSMLESVSSADTYFKGFPRMMEKCVNAQLPLALLSFEKGDDGMKLYGLFKALSECMSTIQTLEEQPEAAEIIKFLGLESFKTIDEIYKVRSKEPKYELPNETKQYLVKYRAAVDREKVDA